MAWRVFVCLLKNNNSTKRVVCIPTLQTMASFPKKRSCGGDGEGDCATQQPVKRHCMPLLLPPPAHKATGSDEILDLLTAAATISGWTKQQRHTEVRQVFRRTRAGSLLKWCLAAREPVHLSISAIQVRSTSNFNSDLPGTLVLYDEQTAAPFFCPATKELQDLIFRKLPSMEQFSGKGRIQHYYSRRVRVFLSFTIRTEMGWGRPRAVVTNIVWLA